MKPNGMAVLLLLLPLAAARAQRPDIPAARLAALDGYLAAEAGRQPMPGFAVAVVSGDRAVFSKGYGVRSLAAREPVTERDLFAIGSLTKSFTAMAVMQQVERGKLSLDDPVIRHLPWFRTADKERSDRITIRMLLSNSSGLPSVDGAMFNRDVTDEAGLRLVRGLGSYLLAGEPGSSFEYSNEGFAVAGLILEKATGLPYRESIRRSILEPLGMDVSTTDPAVLAKVRTATPHTVGIDAGIPSPSAALSASYIAAGSLLHCSAENLSRYLIALLNGGAYRGARVLSASGVAALWTPEVSFAGRSVEEGGDGSPGRYGLGWMIAEVEGRRMILHGGNTGAMTSWAALLPESGLGVAILTNIDSLDPYRYPQLMTIGNNVFHILSGEPTTAYGVPKIADPTLNSYELPQSLYSRYVGRYSSFDSNGAASIDISEGRSGLTAEISRGADFTLRAALDFVNESLAEGRSIGPAYPIRFRIRPDGRVLACTLPLFGMTMSRERQGESVPTAGVPGRFSFPLPQPWKTANGSGPVFADGTRSPWTVRAEDSSADGYALSVFELEDPGAQTGEEPDWAAWERRLGMEAASRGLVSRESISGIPWFERAYEGAGAAAGQQMLCLANLRGGTYGILLSTPSGGLAGQAGFLLQRIMPGFTITGR